MRAVQPRAAVGQDGAELKTWWKGVADALRHPWRFMTVDFSKKPEPPPPIAPFERLRACAASSDPGCVEARKQLKTATNRGLAAALGRPLPKELAR